MLIDTMKNVKTFTIVALSLTLIACGGGALNIKTDTQEVLIPVALQCPSPPKIERPILSTTGLTDDSTYQEVAEALTSTIFSLIEYSKTLEDILQSYE